MKISPRPWRIRAHPLYPAILDKAGRIVCDFTNSRHDIPDVQANAEAIITAVNQWRQEVYVVIGKNRNRVDKVSNERFYVIREEADAALAALPKNIQRYFEVAPMHCTFPKEP